jgi:hypothetical protein
MSKDIQYPELPSHLVWWSTTGKMPYVLLAGSNEGVAWVSLAEGGRYRCVSAPHGVDTFSWVEQFAETEQEAVNLIHAWAVMETRHE